jgi:DNA-binding MarR family transcriptional regulator
MPSLVDSDAFGFLIGDLSRMLRSEMERRIAGAGLAITPGEGRTLAHIARHGVVRQNVLAERIGVEAMTLSGFLDRLEVRGLVERSADPADRRAKLVNLTDAAEEMLGEIHKLSQAMREELSRILPDGEWARLTEGLKTIRDRLVDNKCDPARKDGPIA